MDLVVHIGCGSLLHFSASGHVVTFVVAQPSQAKLLGARAIKAITMTFLVIVMIVITVIVMIVMIVITVFVVTFS